MLSCVQLCLTIWTAAHQAPWSTEGSKQEYWSALPFLSTGIDPGVKPIPPVSPALAGGSQFCSAEEYSFQDTQKQIFTLSLVHTLFYNIHLLI